MVSLSGMVSIVASRRSGRFDLHHAPSGRGPSSAHEARAAPVRQRRSSGRPSGFIQPCPPSRAERPPSGPLWVHEIKHDGYRLMVRRDGSRIRLSQRPLEDVGPSRRTRRARWSGGSAGRSGANLGAPRPSWFCQNGKHDEGEYSHAENDSGDPGNFDVEGPSWIKCHGPSCWRQPSGSIDLYQCAATVAIL
jgi:hypothetical protein